MSAPFVLKANTSKGHRKKNWSKQKSGVFLIFLSLTWQTKDYRSSKLIYINQVYEPFDSTFSSFLVVSTIFNLARPSWFFNRLNSWLTFFFFFLIHKSSSEIINANSTNSLTKKLIFYQIFNRANTILYFVPSTSHSSRV